jgi:hypothetical protein
MGRHSWRSERRPYLVCLGIASVLCAWTVTSGDGAPIARVVNGLVSVLVTYIVLATSLELFRWWRSRRGNRAPSE